MRSNRTALPLLFNLLAFVLASLLGAAATLASDRCASVDFNELSAAGNDRPRDLWSDGTTMWVVDSADAKIYAYDLTTKARVASREFDTLKAAGNTPPYGLWSDGTTMWVGDVRDAKIYAYDLTTKARVASREFNTLSAAGNEEPRSLWSDGTTMWVVDSEDAKIYAYDLTTKARATSMEFDTLIAAGNNDPRGLWSDGTTMWVGDWADDKIYAYDLTTKARATSKEFDTLIAANNTSPYGLWSNGATMWVVDWSNDKIYAYSLPCPPDVVVTSRASDSLTISWTQASCLTYAVSQDGGIRYVDVGATNTYTFTGLSPDTSYSLKVKTTQAAGIVESATIVERTTSLSRPSVMISGSSHVTLAEGSEAMTFMATGSAGVTYAWVCTGGAPTPILRGEDTASLSFIPSDVTEDTDYMCEVTVTGDGVIAEGEASASVVITVTDELADTSSPVFAGSIPGSPFVFTVGTPMSVNLPTASDENPVTYAFTSTVFLPTGLIFTNANPPTLSGTTMAAADDYGPYTYVATDDQGNLAATSPAFMIRVTRARAEISFGVANAITAMGATVPVASDTEAVIHYGVVEVDGAPPDTLDEVRALTAYATLTIDTGQVATMQPAVLTGLMADTSYKLYAVLVGEGGGVLSEYGSSPAFTTRSRSLTIGADESRLGVIAYPNPVGDTLYLELPLGDDYLVAVLTLTGQMVIEGRYGGGSLILDFFHPEGGSLFSKN